MKVALEDSPNLLFTPRLELSTPSGTHEGLEFNLSWKQQVEPKPAFHHYLDSLNEFEQHFKLRFSTLARGININVKDLSRHGAEETEPLQSGKAVRLGIESAQRKIDSNDRSTDWLHF